MKPLKKQGWCNRMVEFIQMFFKPSVKAGGIACGTLALVYLLLPIYEELINVSVVKWTQAYYQSNVFFDIVYTCTIVLTTIALCRWIIRHKMQWIQWRYIEVLIGLILIWGYYRFFNEIWSFKKVFNTTVSYVDIWVLQLLALVVCMVIVNIGVYRKYMRNNPNSASNQSILQLDNPIAQVDDDVIGRRHFTRDLAGIVRGLDLKESSYSIAVTAPWGDGKTSFINLLKNVLENSTGENSTKKELTDKKVVDKKDTGIRIINFTPWLFSPGTSITKAFYLLLARELGGINRHLSNLIKRYLELLDANFETGLSHMYEKDTLQKVQSDIKELLKSNKGRIVVIIDDIDRLSSEEIIEVFKIIRGSANFPNIVFISCFDKEYVNTALQKHSEALKNTYIEKFFQLEFSLPRYNKEVLRDMAKRFAEQLFVNSSDDLNNFKNYIKKPESSLVAKMDIVNYFANPRQLIRWLNNLYLSYSAIKGECYVADLSDIELLKMYYPSIYSLISDSFEEYFTISNSGVKLWDKTADSKTRWLSETHKDLHDSEEYSRLDTIGKENVNAIFSRLTDGYSSEKALRFATPGYSMRYFFGMLQEDEVSQTDFLNLLTMGADEMIAEIDKSYLERMEGLTLLCQTVEVEDPKSEENIIRMVLYLSSQSNRYAFDVGKLMSRLEKIGENNDERKKKLMELIQTTPLSAWVSTVFRRSLYYHFPLSRKPNGVYEFLSESFMDEVQRTNMKKAYDAKLGFKEMRELYRLSCHNFLTDAQIKKKMLKAEELSNPTDNIMRNFIIETMEQNIGYLYYDGENNKILSNDSSASKAYGISWPFNMLWDSWADVVTYASSKGYSLSNNDKLNELGALFDKYKNKCEAVEFELKYLNPPVW